MPASQVVTREKQPLLRISSADKQYEDLRQPVSASVSPSDLKKRQSCGGGGPNGWERYLIPEFVSVHRVRTRRVSVGLEIL